MSDRRGFPPPCQMVPLTTTHAESRGSCSPRIGEQMPTPPDNKVKSYSHFAAHCSVTAKAQDKFTRHQNIERYRRLLKTATDEERRNYLARLIVEELQKQKDAGDSDYQY
jgi:hypothetical protein